MTNNLKLITTETFGDLTFNFYYNRNNDILLAREQIGIALEYVNPDVALNMIHKRHKKNKLDSLSVVAKLLSTDQKNMKQYFIFREELWRYTFGVINPKQINLWIGMDNVKKYRNRKFIHISQQR